MEKTSKGGRGAIEILCGSGGLEYIVCMFYVVMIFATSTVSCQTGLSGPCLGV